MTYKTRGLFFEQLTAMSPLNTNNIPTTQSLPIAPFQSSALEFATQLVNGNWMLDHFEPQKMQGVRNQQTLFSSFGNFGHRWNCLEIGWIPMFLSLWISRKITWFVGETKILVQFKTGEISKLSDSQSPAFLVSKVYGLHTHLVCKQVNYVVSGEQFFDGRWPKPIYVFLWCVWHIFRYLHFFIEQIHFWKLAWKP